MNNLHQLYYSDKGSTHIKRGIWVTEFTSLDRNLPRKFVTQGIAISFKYTGQPMYYRCGSTEHIVKDWPKQQRGRFSHIPVKDRTLPLPPHLPNKRKPQNTNGALRKCSPYRHLRYRRTLVNPYALFWSCST